MYYKIYTNQRDFTYGVQQTIYAENNIWLNLKSKMKLPIYQME